MDPVSYDSLRYVASNRWDPTHLEKVDRLLALAPGDKVLEVGSSGGHLLRRLLDRGVDAVGVDANPKAAADRILHMGGEHLDFPDASFDAVISVHTIEHIPTMTRALSEIALWQYCCPSAQKVYPHSNVPAGAVQPPYPDASWPAAFASHSLPCTAPSQPQVG